MKIENLINETLHKTFFEMTNKFNIQFDKKKDKELIGDIIKEACEDLNIWADVYVGFDGNLFYDKK